ncbi:hypothetical protein CDAR_289281 [Caerostris darwini]|uniref:Uncharacterized protein n=1 Tax=Caerostris darwini TaxID=1538125 RepID=A0AAV4PI48_9ARAC|nr:hypothetical protein CDAR_289281 [Caerostris darwini]
MYPIASSAMNISDIIFISKHNLAQLVLQWSVVCVCNSDCFHKDQNISISLLLEFHLLRGNETTLMQGGDSLGSKTPRYPIVIRRVLGALIMAISTPFPAFWTVVSRPTYASGIN